MDTLDSVLGERSSWCRNRPKGCGGLGAGSTWHTGCSSGPVMKTTKRQKRAKSKRIVFSLGLGFVLGASVLLVPRGSEASVCTQCWVSERNALVEQAPVAESLWAQIAPVLAVKSANEPIVFKSPARENSTPGFTPGITAQALGDQITARIFGF